MWLQSITLIGSHQKKRTEPQTRSIDDIIHSWSAVSYSAHAQGIAPVLNVLNLQPAIWDTHFNSAKCFRSPWLARTEISWDNGLLLFQHHLKLSLQSPPWNNRHNISLLRSLHNLIVASRLAIAPSVLPTASHGCSMLLRLRKLDRLL